MFGRSPTWVTPFEANRRAVRCAECIDESEDCSYFLKMVPFRIVVLCFACLRALGETYFVSPEGSDSNSGLSQEAAWKSIEHVNARQFKPGDSLLFKGGGRFAGTLRLGLEDSGSSEKLVTVASFGDGAARIDAGRAGGIEVMGTEHLCISNLVVSGAGALSNDSSGIRIFNTRTNERSVGIILDSLDVSGFGEHGIFVSGTSLGYENVLIARSAVHANRKGGIEVAGKLPWDSPLYAHKNVTISECSSYDNTGDSRIFDMHTGSGIVLYQVDHGRIEHSAAWNNGADCPAPNAGPVGIWTCASRKVVIEFCESFKNSSRGLDGGGFDLDGGSEDCILQYNYSHDNKGPGLMVYTYPYSSHHDRSSIVRFNISVDDAAQSERYGGLWVRADGNPIEKLQIHNNTVITDGPHAAFLELNNVEAVVENNIFLSDSNGIPFRAIAAGGPGAYMVAGNWYWRSGAPFAAQWNDARLSSLAELEALGSNTSGTARFEDPQINWAMPNLPAPFKGFYRLTQFRPLNHSAYDSARHFASVSPVPLRDFLGRQLKLSDSMPYGAAGR